MLDAPQKQFKDEIHPTILNGVFSKPISIFPLFDPLDF